MRRSTSVLFILPPAPLSGQTKRFTSFQEVIFLVECLSIIWPHRLTVRTPGFHPGNRSSILREVTRENTPSNDWVFSLVNEQRSQFINGVSIVLSLKIINPPSKTVINIESNQVFFCPARGCQPWWSAPSRKGSTTRPRSRCLAPEAREPAVAGSDDTETQGQQTHGDAEERKRTAGSSFGQ